MKFPAALQEFKNKCDANGFRKGESAKEFAERNAVAARECAEFLGQNLDKVSKELSRIVG